MSDDSTTIRSTGWMDVTVVESGGVAFVEHKNPGIGEYHDILHLMYENEEVEVSIYKEPFNPIVRHVRVTKVISPYLFLTEYDHERPLLGFKDWRDAMQDYYASEEARKYFQVETSILLKYRCYAYHDPETGLWERVRVMKYCTVRKQAEVYMFEHCEFRVVNKVDFMELDPDFCKWAAQSTPTHLLSICPLNNQNHWSLEAVEYFKSLVEDQSFYCTTIEQTFLPFPECFPETLKYIGVLLLQRNPMKPFIVQGEMVRAGYAGKSGLFSGYNEMFLSGGLREFGTFDLEQFVKTAASSDHHVVPSPKLVRITLRSSIEKAETLWKTVGYVESMIDFIPDMFTAHVQEDTQSFLSENFEQRLCQIRFSFISSPSILYIQLENNVNQLREMETTLSLMVMNEGPVAFDDATSGLPISCLIKHDKYREAVWLRAIVRLALPAVQLFKVILVDYGTEMSVKQSMTRYLPIQFHNIPSFALRVHLDSTMLVPNGGRVWSNMAADMFRKYMSSWNQVVPVHYACIPDSASEIVLEDYNQEIWWEPATHKWTLTDRDILPINTHINELKSHPLLKNLYTSTGIDIFYEVKSNSVYSPHTFQTVAKTLINAGYANRLVPTKSMRDQHTRIVNAVTNRDYVNRQKIINGIQLDNYTPQRRRGKSGTGNAK